MWVQKDTLRTKQEKQVTIDNGQWTIVVSLRDDSKLCFCALDNCGQEAFKFTAIFDQRGVLLVVDVFCCVKESEPVVGLGSFFQRYAQLGKEVGTALCLLCFTNICANTGAAFEIWLESVYACFFSQRY